MEKLKILITGSPTLYKPFERELRTRGHGTVFVSADSVVETLGADEFDVLLIVTTLPEVTWLERVDKNIRVVVAAHEPKHFQKLVPATISLATTEPDWEEIFRKIETVEPVAA